MNNILPLLDRLDKVKDQLQNEADCSFLFVNDGSMDGTPELLDRIYRERGDVRVIDLIHNFGHSAAITCGIDHFKGDIAILMDADLQDDPTSIAQMYEHWKAGKKTVVAERGTRKEKNRILFKTFYYIFHKFNRRLPPINFGTHCLLDRSVVDRIGRLKEKNRYFPGLVSFSSGKIQPIRFDRHARTHGESRVGMFGLINLAVTALLSFSTVPVRLVSIIGLLAAVIGFGTGLYVLYQKFFTDNAILGWASTIAGISFASGIQLLCLGIIGEYMARIYDEVKERPVYFVERTLEKTAKKKAA